MSVCICFGLKSSLVDSVHSDTLEKEYQRIYKPLAKFLYSHSLFRMFFSFTGPQLEFYRKKHPEFIELMQKLIERKQIEILGGGYYNPVFPLLFPRDRSGQIELLSSSIREAVGKRPRGISLYESIWDSSLLSCFSTSGMEFVLLDESLVPPGKNMFVPLIMSDKGKSLAILPVAHSIKPSPDSPVSDFLADIDSSAKKSRRSAEEIVRSQKPVITVRFSLQEISALLESGWLEKFSCEIENEKCSSDIPAAVVKNAVVFQPVFIAAGMSGEIAQWAVTPYKPVKPQKHFPVTVYDFLQLYPQSKALYDRMMYVSMLMNQSHGDKIRKRTAREKVWESQNGNCFFCMAAGSFINSSYRQNSFKNLAEAEKIIRECNDFEESVSSFDYNGDGLNEYIIRMQNYVAVVHPAGGAIRELDLFQSSGNYADNLSRIEEFEGCGDDYERGLFVDHMFSEEEFAGYLLNKLSGNGVFSKLIYSESLFSQQRKEIQLSVSALFKNRQQVSLKKKILATSSGLMIQYILKNESESPLNAKFAVESSFAQTNFTAEDFNAYKLEILTDGQKKVIDTKSSSKDLNSSGTLSNVEGFQLTDTDNAISFMFEPNEQCGLSFFPIVFNRPEYTAAGTAPAGMTFSNTLFWDIDLMPGMEMEKTINLSIFSMHKKRRTAKGNSCTGGGI